MQTAAAPVSMPKDPLARLKGELSSLEATARGRLKGTRVGDLVERFPRALEGEVDALLDKVGLVRKAKAPVVAAATDVVAAADVVAAPSDVDVSADVVAEVAAAAGRKGKKGH
jgi:hypothetical protein